MTHTTLPAILALTGSALSLILAIGGLLAAPRRIAPCAFAMLMACLAGMQFSAFMNWERLQLLASAALPGLGLGFSVSFARRHAWTHMRAWRWGIALVLALPLGLAARLTPVARNWTGCGFYLLLLISAAVIIAQLEKTLRASAGSIRAQIKFVALGIGSVFAAQLYTASQTLFLGVRPASFTAIETTATMLGCLLITAAWRRQLRLDAQLDVARSFPTHAISLKVALAYLLLAIAFPTIFRAPLGDSILPAGVLWAGAGLLLAILVLSSDIVRYESRRFLNRHVFRMPYDYRRVWLLYTQRMASIVDPQELCNVIVRLVSNTFGVPAVTVWLFPAGAQDRFVIGGSTMYWNRPNLPQGWEHAVQTLMTAMLPQTMPIDVASPLQLQSSLPEGSSDILRAIRIRYGAILVSGQQALGMITLSDRLTREPLVAEDMELLKTIADQAAASLHNAQLSQHLLHARRMDAFQTVSTFFVHDLKNLAAKLSLMVQNLPAHYDNPEFRDDMLQVISKSVIRMNAMCSRLTLFTHAIDLHPTATDLNALIRDVVAELQGASAAQWRLETLPLPPLQVDQEQMKKVIGNLLLNALEAMGPDGEIGLTTAWIEPWAMLTISDNGCGMSHEFLTDKLFEPFQTTKSQGLGIGMFHSKKIIESHHGRIEVESIEGVGSTFRILLPAASHMSEAASHATPPGVLKEALHQ